MRLTLYSFWRSSCSWRVRIGLAWKGLEYAYRAVDLGAGSQFLAEHRTRNPMAQVPVLEVEEGGAVHRLSQSVAILEWLEERVPSPPLLPADALGRARVRALVEHVNAGIQPYQNTAPRRFLAERHPGLDDELTRRWVADGLAALEAEARAGAGRFSHGDAPTLADLYLVPQLFGARRFGVSLEGCPTLLRIEAACQALPAFAAAVPERQPDARV